MRLLPIAPICAQPRIAPARTDAGAPAADLRGSHAMSSRPWIAPSIPARPREAVVVRGRAEPLSSVPFHDDGPLRRWLMASGEGEPALPVFVALHEFSAVEEASRAYCQPHVHDFDEINVLHTSSSLRVDLLLGDEVVTVDAPATVFIPAGLPHSANVRSGEGVLVAILLSGEYRATAP
jgi:hypothetical protein